MNYSDLIAVRYMRSRQNRGFVSFISGIAILGVMLGTATLIIALSILGGFEREITEKVVGFTSHIQVLSFRNVPLRDYDENATRIERAFPIVRSVSPFVAREALIRSSAGVEGVLLKGVEPLRDNSSTRRYIVDGEYNLERQQGALPRLVLGRRLAARLDLGVGDKATLFGLGRIADDGQPRVVQFRVSGLYESGMAEYDDVWGFTDLASAQKLFGYDDAVSGYDVMLTRVDSADAVALNVQDLLGYPHFGRTVFDSYRNLFSWIELQKQPVPIILGLIIIVATVNIIGTLLMMVLDKTKEIGILRSMGATRWGIMRIFLRQGLTIAVIGTALGNGLALGLCMLQQEFRILSLPSDIYFMTSVPILIRLDQFAWVSAISVALCLASSWRVAKLAAKVNPIKAMRFN